MWKSKYLSASDGLKVVAWDLDSTVRSTVHRRHLLPKIHAGEATWDDYSMLCSEDQPIPGAVRLVYLLGGSGYLNIAVSGASEAAEELTVSWCAQHDVPFDDYILRPAGDKTDNGIFKVNVVRRLQQAGLNVVLFVEDWEPAARLVAEQTDVPVLGVNPFDADSVLTTQAELAEVLEYEFTESSYVGGAELAVNVFGELKKRRKGPLARC